MGSKKESLKKSLGITEYPWSSDEDSDAANVSTNPHLIHRTDHRPSASDMPGTSGVQRASSSESQTQARRDQERRDRDMFWSHLNNPGRIQLPPSPIANRSRIDVMPIRFVGQIRRPHTAASAADEIQRVVSIKRLLNRARSYATHLRNSGHRTPTVRAHRMNERGLLTRPIGACPNQRLQCNSAEEPLALTTRRQLSVQLNDILNTSPITPIQNEPNNPGPSTSLQAPSFEPHEEMELIQLGDSMQYNSATDVQMDTGDATGNANTIIDLDNENNETTENQQETSNHNSVSENAVPQQSQEQHNNRLKRKRRSDDEISQPFTVKEFNQRLLRLLECPVCLEWMEPAMSQCRRGHLVCGGCRARLTACPVCRTTFSSVRNRAMESVAELVRYPCRHHCGAEVSLRRRAAHEASCHRRHYACPAPACRYKPSLPRDKLHEHFQNVHMSMVKEGSRHVLCVRVNTELHEDWLVHAEGEYFHLRVDVDVRVALHVVYIGPKCDANKYTYQVTVVGEYCGRRVTYARQTHNDLESSSLNVSRQDCFFLTLDHALNFIRYKNRNCNTEKYLELNVEIAKVEVAVKDRNESDS